MRVTAEIFQNLSGAAEGRFRVNHPLGAAKRTKEVAELARIAERGAVAEEVELSAVEGGLQGVEKEAAEQTGEDADWEEEVRTAADPAGTVRAKPAARDGAMDVRMIEQVLAPGVEDGEEAEIGSQVFRVAREGEQGLGNGAQEDAVNHAWVLESEGVEWGGDSEDDVKVGNGEEFGLAAGEPTGALRVLALGAMPIAAGVVGDALMLAVGALFDVTA
jgi:hypothetical protein